mmetsp:Transcript_22632/g.57810  ORF Transcript_22632/g.57810 Transcript_22632/m.57810 type:complete len:324 (+) Transcript_22632:326-1297(+)
MPGPQVSPYAAIPAVPRIVPQSLLGVRVHGPRAGGPRIGLAKSRGRRAVAPVILPELLLAPGLVLLALPLLLSLGVVLRGLSLHFDDLLINHGELLARRVSSLLFSSLLLGLLLRLHALDALQPQLYTTVSGVHHLTKIRPVFFRAVPLPVHVLGPSLGLRLLACFLAAGGLSFNPRFSPDPFHRGHRPFIQKPQFFDPGHHAPPVLGHMALPGVVVVVQHGKFTQGGPKLHHPLRRFHLVVGRIDRAEDRTNLQALQSLHSSNRIVGDVNTRQCFQLVQAGNLRHSVVGQVELHQPGTRIQAGDLLDAILLKEQLPEPGELL